MTKMHSDNPEISTQYEISTLLDTRIWKPLLFLNILNYD